MALAVFSTDLSYNTGDVVTYEGVTYAFITPHVAGAWDITQVLSLNPAVSYIQGVQDFNTIPDYNVSRPIGAPKYRVTYLPNNDEIIVTDQFVQDNNVYAVGELVTIQDYPYVGFSQDGIWKYTFIGWAHNKNTDGIVTYTSGVVTMPSQDIILYAVWAKTPTISVDASQAMTLNPLYKDSISKLVIPEYFNGTRIKEIQSFAFLNSSVKEVVIPPNIIKINENAFEGWSGDTIRFIDADVTAKYPKLTLRVNCFINTPNLVSIILPYRWQGVERTIPEAWEGKMLFGAEANKAAPFNIYIRNTKSFMQGVLSLGASDPESTYFSPNNVGLNYTRLIHWGYND